MISWLRTLLKRRRFKGLNETPSERKCHESIYELPIILFNKCIKENSLRFLIISGSYTEDELLEKWENIHKELIETFGVPYEYGVYLRLMKMRAKELKRVWINGEKYRESFAELYRQRALEFIKSEEVDFFSNMSELSRAVGFRLNPNEVTVGEYFGYVRSLEREVTNKAQINGK